MKAFEAGCKSCVRENTRNRIRNYYHENNWLHILTRPNIKFIFMYNNNSFVHLNRELKSVRNKHQIHLYLVPRVCRARGDPVFGDAKLACKPLPYSFHDCFISMYSYVVR